MAGNVIVNTEEVFKLDDEAIQDLKRKALALPERHIRVCMHRDLSDPVHEMIIVHCRGEYVRPHRHLDKTESCHVLEGTLVMVLFDDRGEPVDRLEMGERLSGSCCVCRMERGMWHMGVPTSDIVVFHEITKGPFTGRGDSVFPDWAPERDAPAGVEAFMKRVMQ